MTQSPDLNPILERLEAESSKLANNISELEKLKPLTEEIELIRECINYLKGNLTFIKSAHDETLSALNETVNRWESIREEIKAHVRLENSELFKKVKDALDSNRLQLIEKLVAQLDLRASGLENAVKSSQDTMGNELSSVEERLRADLPSKNSIKVLTALMVLVLIASVCALLLLALG